MMTTEAKPNEKILLRVPEAAQLLGIGQTTVHRLIRQGRLRIIKIDRSTRITRSELEDFVRRSATA